MVDPRGSAAYIARATVSPSGPWSTFDVQNIKVPNRPHMQVKRNVIWIYD